MIQFLVTTQLADIPSYRQIVMIDGTVPGWERKLGDLHFDHHRPGGANVQIEEIPEEVGRKIGTSAAFVTTQVDADACAAAAWLILELQDAMGAGIKLAPEAKEKLLAISYDCDHLGVPPELEEYREFAAKAVAALKESGSAIAAELGLPSDRKSWSAQDKQKYATTCFEQGAWALHDAALGTEPWPGERGEAEPYFQRLEQLRPLVYEHCRLVEGCAVFDQRTFAGYVDPRLLVDWARENSAPLPFTLTVRDGSRLPNALTGEQAEANPQYSYTLGHIPLHPLGCPNYSDNGYWGALAFGEIFYRESRGIPAPETTWGGLNAVGGSGWNDPALKPPESVINLVLVSYYSKIILDRSQKLSEIEANADE